MDFSIENKFSGKVAGIDEAGRGPLSGPVVAACLFFSDQKNIPKKLDDSKKLSAKIREEIFLEPQNSAIFGVSIIESSIIDEINILNATKLAMKKSYENLLAKISIDHLIIDGNFVPDFEASTKPKSRPLHNRFCKQILGNSFFGDTVYRDIHKEAKNELTTNLKTKGRLCKGLWWRCRVPPPSPKHLLHARFITIAPIEDAGVI